jgi:hypothetical protein
LSVTIVACGGVLGNGDDDGGFEAGGDSSVGGDATVDGATNPDAAEDALSMLDSSDASASYACIDAGVVACDGGAPPACEGCVTPTVLGACQPLPVTLTFDDATVYWQNDGLYISGGGNLPVHYASGSLVACAKAGCANAPTVFATNLSYITGTNSQSLAVASGSVYYDFEAPNADAGASGIRGLGSSSCAATSTMVGWADHMVADVTRLYWSNQDIESCALSGCTQPTIVWSDPKKDTTGIAADATSVYWGTSSGDLMTCPKTGCVGAPTILAALGVPVGEWVVVDDTNIYASSEIGIFRCAKTGCDGSPSVVVAAAYESPFATDGVNIYWAHANLYECPITGCDGDPTLIASGSQITSVAIDDARVYWTDEALGLMLSLPK